MKVRQGFKLAAVFVLVFAAYAFAQAPSTRKYHSISTPNVADTTTILTGFGKIAWANTCAP